MQTSLEILLEFIQLCCKGRNNAMTGEKLSSYFGCDKRTIQQEIESLRKEGYPILSSDQGQKGYFYPKNAQEAAEGYKYLRSMRKRALMTLITFINIRKGLDSEFGNQLELPDLKGAA